MNQENVNKLVDWIKANRNYSAEQLKQSALQGESVKFQERLGNVVRCR